MPNSPFAATAAAILITLGGGLSGVGQAQAKAIYTGTFDPRGAVYGFSGTQQFAVDETCLTTVGWKHVNGYSGSLSNSSLYPSCGNVYLTGGTLTLRKYATSGSDENAPRAIPDQPFNFFQANSDWNPTLDWGGGVGAMQIYIQSIYVAFNPLTGRNELAGVDTPETFGSFGAFDGQNWALRWVSGQQPTDVFGSTTDPAGVYLLQDCDAPYTGQCVGGKANVPVATATFNRVPEPGSIALLAAALMAAGLATRHARRA